MRNDFKRISDIIKDGEKVIVSRPHNEMARAYHNAEYMAMIDRSLQELNEGKVVVKTMEELEELAN